MDNFNFLFNIKQRGGTSPTFIIHLGVGEVEYTIAPNETIFLNYGEGAIVGIKRKGTSSLAVLVSIRFRSIEVICDSQNNYLSLISSETGLNITNISSSSIIIVCKRIL